MNKATQDMELRAIRERAAEWVCELEEGALEQHAEFAAWMRQSPRHVEEFLFAATAWKALDDVGPQNAAEVDAAVAKAIGLCKETEAKVVDWPVNAGGSSTSESNDTIAVKPAQEPRVPATQFATAQVVRSLPATRQVHFGKWAAAIIATVATGVFCWYALGAGSAYTTAVGEQRSIRLADGSTLYLNTASRARIRFSDSARDIELDGEGLFVVAQDRERPFRVKAGNTTIQAIGTQFNVNGRGRDIKVSVLEGKVKIVDRAGQTTAVAQSAEFLGAGEEAVIANDGRIAKRHTSDVAEATAWRERRLIFRGETLEAIAQEVNRYNPRHFRIEGEAARAKRLVGTFAADDPEALVRFLQQYEDLIVEVTGDEFIVRER